MNGGQLPTNQLHDINWGALDHASRAPQLMSCNYHVCVCVYVCVDVNIWTVTVASLYLHTHTCTRRTGQITGDMDVMSV